MRCALLLALALPAAIAAHWPPAAPIATLVAPDSAAGDGFGEHLAVNESFIAVGAPYRDAGPTQDVGAIYIFDRSTLAFQRRIDPPVPLGFRRFPYGLSFGPQNRLIAADYFQPTVPVFNAATGSLVRSLAPVGAPQIEGFGAAVAASDKYFAVSHLFEDNGSGNPGGSVYFYSAPAGDFLFNIDQPFYNQWAIPSAFGNSLDIRGDTLAVGSIYSRPVKASGAGEIVEIDIPKQAFAFSYPDPTEGQNLLGAGVLFSPDGTEILALPGYDDGLPYGFAYVFPRGSATPRLTLQTSGSDGGSEYFGWSAAYVRNEILFGAPRARPGGVNGAGAVYRFDNETGEELPPLANPEPGLAFGAFGAALASEGRHLFVGAVANTGSAAVPAGRVYVYEIAPEPVGNTFVLY